LWTVYGGGCGVTKAIILAGFFPLFLFLPPDPALFFYVRYFGVEWIKENPCVAEEKGEEISRGFKCKRM